MWCFLIVHFICANFPMFPNMFLYFLSYYYISNIFNNSWQFLSLGHSSTHQLHKNLCVTPCGLHRNISLLVKYTLFTLCPLKNSPLQAKCWILLFCYKTGTPSHVVAVWRACSTLLAALICYIIGINLQQMRSYIFVLFCQWATI